MDERILAKREERKRRKIRKKKERLKGLLAIVLVGIVIFLIINRFFYSVITVNGSSMENSLFDGEKILVSKFNINEKTIDRFDILVFKWKDNRYYLKRVVAKPGEMVEIKQGDIYVNGQLLDEPNKKGQYTMIYNTDSWVLGEDEYFLLGDNRKHNDSKDSRIFGPIGLDHIVGKLEYKFKSSK